MAYNTQDDWRQAWDVPCKVPCPGVAYRSRYRRSKSDFWGVYIWAYVRDPGWSIILDFCLPCINKYYIASNFWQKTGRIPKPYRKVLRGVEECNIAYGRQGIFPSCTVASIVWIVRKWQKTSGSATQATSESWRIMFSYNSISSISVACMTYVAMILRRPASQVLRGSLATLALSKKQKAKTTAPRIPTWSPTVVLTRRYSG